MRDDVIFKRFTLGRYPINAFLMADRKTGIGVFIDPGGFSDEIELFISAHKIDLKYIFFTHGHWDHIEGFDDFKSRYTFTSYAPENEVEGVDHVLHGDEVLQVGNIIFNTFSNPGHTAQAVSFYTPGFLFSGDALFCGSMGGVQTQEEADVQIAAVRKHLFPLPQETLVLSGHGPMSTIAAERYYNPFFLEK